jgi:hypothetical protein
MRLTSDSRTCICGHIWVVHLQLPLLHSSAPKSTFTKSLGIAETDLYINQLHDLSDVLAVRLKHGEFCGTDELDRLLAGPGALIIGSLDISQILVGPTDAR